MTKRFLSTGAGKRLLSITVLTISILCFYGVVVDIPWLSLEDRIFIGIIFLVGMVWFFWHSDVRDPMSTDLDHPASHDMTENELEQAIEDASKRYNTEAIEYFVRTFVDLREYLTRVHESATPDGHRLIVRTGQTFIGRNSAKKELKSLLLPLIVTRKGVLIDELQITDSSGSQLPTLSQYETRGLLAITILSMLLIAKRAAQSQGTDVSPNAVGSEQFGTHESNHPISELNAMEMAEALSLAKFLVSPRSHSSTAQNTDQQIQGYEILKGLTQDWRDRIYALCRSMADNYVIAVEIPEHDGTQLVVEYAQSIPIDGYTHTFQGRMRQRLGMSPVNIDAPLTRAFQAESYHFQMNVGPEQYVFDHHLEWMGTRTVVRRDDLRVRDRANGCPIPQYIRAYHCEARPNAHLYIRRQGRALSRGNEGWDVKTVIRLREVPPGALGGATVVAIVNTLIITFFALTRIGIDGSQNQTNADVPALFIALPAFAAAIAGNWADSRRIPRSSLSTYMGLASTMILSVLAAMFYILNANIDSSLVRQITLLGHRSPYITIDVIWLILSFLSLIFALYLIRELRNESRYYFYLVRKSVRKRSTRIDNK